MTRPSGRRPRRRSNPQEQRRVIRVLTEGRVTEPDYLRRWARRNRGLVRVDFFDAGKTPEVLVRQARDCVRQQNPRSRRADPDFDEIWCVFDTDEHRHLSQAVDDARQSRVEVAVSNPCFELWLVLHVQEQTAHIHRHDVQDLASEHGLCDGKKIAEKAWTRLVDDFETAKRRARELDERHVGNGSPPRSNPSTGMWRLVDRLNKIDLPLDDRAR